jgi:hypothetical protein
VAKGHSLPATDNMQHLYLHPHTPDLRLCRFESVASPGLYLAIEGTDGLLSVGAYSVCGSLWDIDCMEGRRGMTHHASRGFLNARIESDGDEDTRMRIRSTETGALLETASGGTVRWQRRNRGNPIPLCSSPSSSAMWLASFVASPDSRGCAMASRPASASEAIEARILADAEGLSARQRSARIYYDARTVRSGHEAHAMLRFVPAVATDADSHIVMPDGEHGRHIADDLLAPHERRRARRVVVASYVAVHAMGGYNAPLRLLDVPWQAVAISVAGPQFEVDYLEAQEFVSVGSSRIRGAVPIRLDGQTLAHLDADAYERAMRRDISLWLAAFSDFVGPSRRGWLRLTAAGMGFFAMYLRRVDLSPTLMSRFLAALRSLAEEGGVPANVRVIELPDFAAGRYWLGREGEGDKAIGIGGVTFLHAPRLDILSPPDAEVLRCYAVGFINPADAFSWKGNEGGWASVEAMVGDNTDMRYVQVPARNPHLGPDKAVPVG